MTLTRIPDEAFLTALETDAAQAAGKQPHSVMIEDQVLIARPDPGFALRGDIYHREKRPSTRRPCVIFMHDWAGGGNPRICGDRQGNFFAMHGLLFVSLYYRPPRYACCPAALEDLKTCARWCRAHAEEYAIDPQAIVAFGSSAGSQWAAMAAITNGQKEFENACGYNDASSDINLVLLNAGIYDVLKDFKNTEIMRIILGGMFDDRPETYRKFSPLQTLHAGVPPFCLIHGTRDASCSIQSARAFRDRILELGGDVELLELPGRDHGSSGHPGDLFIKLNVWKDFIIAHGNTPKHGSPTT